MCIGPDDTAHHDKDFEIFSMLAENTESVGPTGDLPPVFQTKIECRAHLQGGPVNIPGRAH